MQTLTLKIAGKLNMTMIGENYVLVTWISCHNQEKRYYEPQLTELGMSGASSRQSQMVADEMFPDGPGPLDFVDVEDGVIQISYFYR